MNAAHAQLHERLLAGRQALGELALHRPEPRLIELLHRLDDALFESPADHWWGLCKVCHESISPAAMEEHPLISVCLECMDEGQREALEHDLKSAAEVQRALLPPRSTRHDGWEIEYVWEPFGAISGDHVDVVRPRAEGEPLHLLLGDVAGKGLAASLLQAQLHALTRALAPSQTTLSELLGRTNRLLFEATTSSRYATLIAVRLYPDGTVTLANAGHPRPLLADRRGVRPIEGASIPLGMLDHVEYPQREIRLRPGNTLFLYTDGLTEAWSGREEFGVGRAAAAVRRARDHPLPELLRRTRDELEAFLAGGSRGDDLTLLAVRRTA